MTDLENILYKAKESFFQFGVKSLTMDDLARELGISKKTLYKHVDNKSDLVEKVMLLHFKEEKQNLKEIISGKDNAIEEMIAIIKNVLRHLRTIHPSSIYDIQKYYPKSWALFKNFKSDFIYNTILSNIQKGIKEGFYRNNFQPEFITQLYITSIEHLVNPKIFPPSEYKFSDLYIEYVSYHLRGIASEKGRSFLNKTNLNES